jgi:SAM-dependent methyltransferase
MSPTPLPVTDHDKLETIKQWNADPCGSGAAADLEIGTAEFFAAADADRYERAQPWMDDAIGFAAYAGSDVLEVGHGMGGDLMRFSRAGASVTGIDLTPRHHQLTARRFALAGRPVDLRLGDAESMPFADASFDLAYSFGVIHHSPDQAAIVREMHRALRPGGRIVVAVYHRWSLSMAELVAFEARHGRLFRQSWRRTLSTIEARTQGDACPLVHLHTRRSVRGLLSGFEDVSIDARGLWTRSLPGCTPDMQRSIERHLGWFLIATGRKPGGR